MSGFASYPTLWQHGRCRMYFGVDAEKQTNYRNKGGFVELRCPYCQEWTQPGANNGRSFRSGA